MRVPGQPDCFQVVNGPEDGAELPIVRAPLHIGQDPRCEVTISLDGSVQPRHALLTAVSEGYRVRRLTSARVWVNGKRAGMFRSRIVRDGEMVQVGQTALVLECAADGLAKRSRGIVTETDFGWAMQQLLTGAGRTLRGLLSFVFGLVKRVLASWYGVVAIVVVLYLCWPQFNWYVHRFLYSIYSTIIGRFLAFLHQ